MKCDICGKEFKNLGVHKFHAHSDKFKPGEVIVVDHPSELVMDDITEKPLSELISEIKNLLKCYQNQITTKIFEKNGKISEIEITARIQI